jgi:hypothetical protein
MIKHAVKRETSYWFVTLLTAKGLKTIMHYP